MLNKKIRLCFSFLSYFLFISCQGTPVYKEKEIISKVDFSNYKDISNFSFVSMGCPWRVYYVNPKISIFHERLKKKLINKAAEYDETFSDWSEESELKRIEKKSYNLLLCSSPLFLKALIFAKDFYNKTEGVFDITLGQGSLEYLSLSPNKKCFKFSQKYPKNLTFNGFVKGMVLGDMAKIFIRSGLKNFYINAGNGNIVFMLDEKHKDLFKLPKEYFLKGYDKIYFLSQSKTEQEHNMKKHQHIYNPKNRNLKLGAESKVLCSGDLNQMKQWPKISGLSDALSTALTVNPKLTIPKNCQKIN